jgi:hypothetical protein
LLDRVPTGIRIGSEQATSVNLTLVAELPGDLAPQNSCLNHLEDRLELMGVEPSRISLRC